ncbi:transcription factor bHLH149 [Diospyros lotus]|uniref:transcription factor bHLH149 n=1 Tax=Diospyros lotus TaxID=55363 RepID=UPI0022520D85|nr:transcription factor bHLH149 [Diospyros lotus]
MASSSNSNPEVDWNRSRESKRKKRRKIGGENQVQQVKTEKIRWRSEAEQLSYSVKLIEALREAQARRNSSPPAPAANCRTVRDTANRILAVSAKGRSRWSRAILTNRLRTRLNNSNKHKKHKKLKVTGDIRSKKLPVLKRTLPPLQRKVRVLGRLVPGCRKLPFPNLLEEASDYIAALEMQVRAMDALAGLLTGAESFSGPPNLLGSNLSQP